jgi:hypothetical protein
MTTSELVVMIRAVDRASGQLRKVARAVRGFTFTIQGRRGPFAGAEAQHAYHFAPNPACRECDA